ncbi:tripartite tricarboxylate transporter substrate binding protein [Ensifer sp. ENS07]|nr:tripartite tricarboxylate transporter substrate binding protein [Ensifer sp. ENS07]
MATAGTATSALAETFPTRAIRIVVNTGPGGLVDVTTRLVAEKMQENLGQPVVVENRAGGDGLVGILAAKEAGADGYTLLATAATIAIQPAVKKNPGYDLVNDFAGVGPIMRSPYLVVEGAGEPDKTLGDFIARAKADPKKMSYASAGVGTGTHLAAALFLKQAGVDILHIPYKGNGPAMPDVMAGRVNMIFEAYNSGASKLKDGTLKALAVTSTERLSSLPDVPTIAEAGLEDYSYYVYTGLVAPEGTPKEVIDRLSSALQSALSDEAVKARFKEGGGETMSMTPADFDQYLKDDLVRMNTLVEDLGIPKK